MQSLRESKYTKTHYTETRFSSPKQSPNTNTKHNSSKQKISYKVYHNASILTTIAETGLQLYKFGKTASIPNWEEHTNKPTSFTKYIKENQSIKAHTLLLTDIGLEIKDAITQLKKSSEKEKVEIPEKIIACSSVGTEKQKIFYDTLENLQNQKVEMPFCLIIPGELNHVEQKALEIIIILNVARLPNGTNRF